MGTGTLRKDGIGEMGTSLDCEPSFVFERGLTFAFLIGGVVGTEGSEKTGSLSNTSIAGNARLKSLISLVLR